MIFKKKTDDAVSPVVGVMLMLVVTILVAAVVAMFATGILGSTYATPTAVLSVEGSSNGDLVFMHMGGDTLSLDNVAIHLETAGGSGSPTVYTTDAAKFKILPQWGVVSTGDKFKLTYIKIGEGTFTEYTVIDKLSGNTITKGTFIMPPGVKASNSGYAPEKLAIVAFGSAYAESLTLTAGAETTFFVNAIDEFGDSISAGTADSCKVIVNDGATDTVISFADCGFPYTFSTAGEYTVKAVMNGVDSNYNSGTGYDANDPSTWLSGGTISVTVS